MEKLTIRKGITSKRRCISLWTLSLIDFHCNFLTEKTWCVTNQACQKGCTCSCTCDFWLFKQWMLWGEQKIKRKSNRILISGSLEFLTEERRALWWGLERVLCSQSAWYVTLRYRSRVATALLQSRVSGIAKSAWKLLSLVAVVLGCRDSGVLGEFCCRSVVNVCSHKNSFSEMAVAGCRCSLETWHASALPLVVVFCQLCSNCAACNLLVTARYSNKVLPESYRFAGICWTSVKLSGTEM